MKSCESLELEWDLKEDPTEVSAPTCEYVLALHVDGASTSGKGKNALPEKKGDSSVSQWSTCQESLGS